MSDISLSSELLESISAFITVLKSHPELLHNEKLGFFRDYLLSVGARLPLKKEDQKSSPTSAAGDTGDDVKFEEAVEEQEEEEPEEPYPELDEEGVIAADPQNPDQEMGNPDEAATDEQIEKSNQLRSEAVGQYGEGNFEGAVEKYTEAIKQNGGSAMLFAKRGQAFLQLSKPTACIKDCNRALQINPDSAVAFKFRGRAHRLLGHWEEAAQDLRQACKIDFDDQADAWLKEVTPNARKLEEWRLRKKRRDEERELKLRKARMAERARAHAEAKSMPQQADPEDANQPEFNSDFFGAVPGLDKVMNDPEILELFSDPEVAAAFNDVGKNPMNILKYQSNPKVAKLLAILKNKMGAGGGGGPFGGMGGGMGGMPGGMGGMPGMGGFPGAPPGGFGGPTDGPFFPGAGSGPKPAPGDDLD